MGEVRGLSVVLPSSAVALLIAGLALAALPPFALFSSEVQIITALGSSGLPGQWGEGGPGIPLVILLLCSLVAFAGLLSRLTAMVWGTAPEDVPTGEPWSVGHIPLALLGVVLVVLCLALPPPLRRLLETATSLILTGE